MKYYCSADDFFFARGFTFLTGQGEIVKTLKGIQKEGILKFLKLFICAVPFVILTGVMSRFPHYKYSTYISVPATIIIVSLIVGAFLNVWRYNKEYKLYEDMMMNYPSSLDEKIMIYEVSEQGLYYNRYNRTNNSDMMFISWDKVIDGELGILRYTDNTNKDQVEKSLMLTRFYEETRKRYKDFQGTKDIYHKNKKMIIFNKEKGFEVIPLPKSWTNEEISNFVNEIEQYITIGTNERI